MTSLLSIQFLRNTPIKKWSYLDWPKLVWPKPIRPKKVFVRKHMWSNSTLGRKANFISLLRTSISTEIAWLEFNVIFTGEWEILGESSENTINDVEKVISDKVSNVSNWINLNYTDGITINFCKRGNVKFNIFSRLYDCLSRCKIHYFHINIV
jgi:hypothetical protein